MTGRGLAMLLLAVVATARADPPGTPPRPLEAPTTEATAGSPLQSGLDTIEQHLFKALPRVDIETRALDALLHDLDPYSNYLDAGEMAQFQADAEAHFGGIGVALGFEDPTGYPVVDYLLYGGAAAAAGVLRGDLLLDVDGRDTRGLQLEQVSPMLRGAVGSQVSLRVRRAGVAAPLAITLARADIPTPSVRALRRDALGRPDWWLDRRRRLGYARIANLATDTAPGMARVLEELRRGKARGLVLDLRDCIGGLMQGALETADLLVDRGVLLTIRQRGRDQVYEAKRGGHVRLPLVILINQGTASSGEILAGALADNGRGTLVGERSFGKGRIQTLYTLGAGRGGMVLSTGTFQRPNGKTIDRHDVPEGSPDAGIAPQVEVKMTEAERKAWLEFAEHAGGILILSAREQQGAPPDPVLAKAVELLSR